MTEPPDPLPERFDDVEALEEFMTRPDPALVDDLAAIDGDILVLGVGGKMGPTLARLARRAAPGKADCRSRPVLRARRRSEAPGLGHRDDPRRPPRPRSGGGAAAASQRGLHGRTQVRDDGEPAAHLGDERAHSGDGGGGIFRDSRIVAFSTGNVYPWVEVASSGATETMPLGAVGEYAQSCVARERAFEYFSAKYRHAGPAVPPQLRD